MKKTWILSIVVLCLGIGWAVTAMRLAAARDALRATEAELATTARQRDALAAAKPAVPPSAAVHATEPPSETEHERGEAPPAPAAPPVAVAPAPPAAAATPTPPALSEQAINAIEQFDVAMDREFDRLETRAAAASDPQEIETIAQIKQSLETLDELYRRADTVTDPAERMTIQMQMHQEMGRIIGLSRRDRNQRLGRLATDIGYNDPQAIERVIQEIDRIYYETHMDWTKLFNRAPPSN